MPQLVEGPQQAVGEQSQGRMVHEGVGGPGVPRAPLVGTCGALGGSPAPPGGSRGQLHPLVGVQGDQEGAGSCLRMRGMASDQPVEVGVKYRSYSSHTPPAWQTGHAGLHT